ncbi:MAG: cell division protein FtsB [Thermodesulfobacteriota bacterium]|jgi:cell division protein FtsB|nr:cell division protein FtsB [Thermodesulfobacteriota bacterium]
MDLRPMLYLKIGLIVGVILVTIMYLQEQGNIQKNSIQVKISLLKQENEAIEKEIRQLEQKISKLRSDPKTVEKVAKRKLGMVRQDETIYIFHLNDDKK